VQITAPAGTYHYFCFIHPGMTGELDVVAPSAPVSTQADIDRASAVQFDQDRREALATERAAAEPPTGTVRMGVSTADAHVSVDEVLPNHTVKAKAGQTLRFEFPDPHNVHTVVFPDNDSIDPAPQGFDCGVTYLPLSSGPLPPVPCFEVPTTGTDVGELGNPEVIFDPGNATSGVALRSPQALVDSGLHIGTAYGVSPIAHAWNVTVDALTQPGTYTFHCTIHDWMSQTVIVG
jgi:plastocyanin